MRNNSNLPLVDLKMDGHVVSSLSDLPNKILDSIQAKHGKNLAMLQADVKASIVRDLDKIGFMSMRNAVNTLSKRFAVSRVCIYNWINNDRRSL